MRSQVWEAAAGRGVEVEKMREKKRCEERIGCKQVDVGVVQRLAGYLFIGLEVCLLISLCVCIVITSSNMASSIDLSGCLTVTFNDKFHAVSAVWGKHNTPALVHMVNAHTGSLRTVNITCTAKKKSSMHKSWAPGCEVKWESGKAAMSRGGDESGEPSLGSLFLSPHLAGKEHSYVHQCIFNGTVGDEV